MAQCLMCGASLKPGTSRCVKCGTALDVGPPPAPTPQPYSQQPQVIYVQQPLQTQVRRCTKNKTTAGILAILLGGLGFHKFYLGKVGQGILYLLFCWTYIPVFIGICEGIYYLGMNEETFCQKYGQK